jgi:hypothetical protein
MSSFIRCIHSILKAWHLYKRFPLGAQAGIGRSLSLLGRICPEFFLQPVSLIIVPSISLSYEAGSTGVRIITRRNLFRLESNNHRV